MLGTLGTSLPHRQLRKNIGVSSAIFAASLPHRQLRKRLRIGNARFKASLPHRQLRKIIDKLETD